MGHILIASLLFALSSMINKYAMAKETSAERLLPGTFLAGFILLLVYQRQRMPFPSMGLLGRGLAMSAFSMINCVAILLALSKGPVGPVAAVAGSHSVITPILAWIFFHESLNGWQWLAVLMATIGMALVQCRAPEKDKVAYTIWIWFGLALLGALGSSGETLVLDHAVTLKDDGISGLVWSYFFSFIFTSIWFLRHPQRHFGRPFLLGAADGTVSAIGMIFFARALAGGPVGLVAALATAAVIFRALGARLLFGESLPALGWLGVLLAMAAFALVGYVQ